MGRGDHAEQLSSRFVQQIPSASVPKKSHKIKIKSAENWKYQIKNDLKQKNIIITTTLKIWKSKIYQSSSSPQNFTSKLFQKLILKILERRPIPAVFVGGVWVLRRRTRGIIGEEKARTPGEWASRGEDRLDRRARGSAFPQSPHLSPFRRWTVSVSLHLSWVFRRTRILVLSFIFSSDLGSKDTYFSFINQL